MIESIINSDKAELTQNTKRALPVVLSTRVRLARNLLDAPFPERASMAQRSDVMAKCANQIADLSQMKNGAFFDVAELSELERQVLLERHLISRELCNSQSGSGVFINKDQTCSVMINEEDHLRIQFLKTGFVCVPSGSKSTDLILAWKMSSTSLFLLSSAISQHAQQT